MAVPFVAATVAAASTGLYLNKLIAKVRVARAARFAQVSGYGGAPAASASQFWMVLPSEKRVVECRCLEHRGGWQPYANPWAISERYWKYMKIIPTVLLTSRGIFYSRGCGTIYSGISK